MDSGIGTATETERTAQTSVTECDSAAIDTGVATIDAGSDPIAMDAVTTATEDGSGSRYTIHKRSYKEVSIKRVHRQSSSQTFLRENGAEIGEYFRFKHNNFNCILLICCFVSVEIKIYSRLSLMIANAWPTDVLA